MPIPITIPNVFSNGQNADAGQVNADFTALANDFALAVDVQGDTMQGPLTTQNLTVAPSGTSTSSQNFPSYEWKFQRSYWNSGAATTATSYFIYDTSGTLHWYNESGTSIWQIDQSGDVTVSAVLQASRYTIPPVSSGSIPPLWFSGAQSSGFNPSNNAGIYVNSAGQIVLNSGEQPAAQLNGGQLNALVQSISGGYKMQSASVAAATPGTYTVSFGGSFSNLQCAVATYYSNGNAASVPCTVTAQAVNSVNVYISSGYTGGYIEVVAIGT